MHLGWMIIEMLLKVLLETLHILLHQIWQDLSSLSVQEIGLWPNDALMCKQIFPFKLKQMYPFVTELQGVKSTTQG